MAWKIDTSEFPNAERNPWAYEGTIAAIEGRHGQTSGEPFVNITWETAVGKRYSSIFLKNKWFASSFEGPKSLTPDEFRLWARSIGAKNQDGDIAKLLGDVTPTVDDFNSLVETLDQVAVGKSFWLVEKQRRDKDGAVQDGYNISIYTERPKRFPAGTRVIERKPEASAAGD